MFSDWYRYKWQLFDYRNRDLTRTDQYKTLAADFDGMSIYMDVTISKEVNVSKGVFIEIPGRGFAGWVATRGQTLGTKLTIVPRFVSLDKFNPNEASEFIDDLT